MFLFVCLGLFVFLGGGVLMATNCGSEYHDLQETWHFDGYGIRMALRMDLRTDLQTGRLHRLKSAQQYCFDDGDDDDE